MSDPNTVLSVWQLVIIAVVPLSLLVGWIAAIFIAARPPRARGAAARIAPVSAGPWSSTGPGGAVVAEDGKKTPTAPDRVAA